MWAKDESSGEVALKRIAQTFERVAPSTLALTFSNGETIETTVEHPFYVQDRGFVPAGLVALGNSIVTRAGPSLQVTAVEKHSSPQRVYNFEVEDYHSYFVGESSLWVHNADYAPKVIHDGQQGKHIPGHNNYSVGKSILDADPNGMLAYLGTGTALNQVIPGMPGFRERINFGYVIGRFVDQGTGDATETTNAIAHYSKQGIHFVPARP